MSTGESAQSVSLSTRLTNLFVEVRDPKTGRKYSPRGVEQAIRDQVERLPAAEQKPRTLSHAYIWQLLRGYRDNPTLGHLQSLAEFFGVQPSYFTDTNLTEADIERQALLAGGLRDETTRQIMVLLVRSDEGTREVVLQLLSHVSGLRSRGTTESDESR